VPTYQYACTACEHRFDAVQSFTDASLTECPECGGKLRKLYGSVGVVFKGSGFYRTDSRSEAKAPATAPAGSTSEKSSEKPEKSSSEKKTESAPAAKKDAPSSSSGTTNKTAIAS